MKVRDLEKLATLLDEFFTDATYSNPGVEGRKKIEEVKTFAENEVFELKRRGKTETPKSEETTR